MSNYLCKQTVMPGVTFYFVFDLSDFVSQVLNNPSEPRFPAKLQSIVCANQKAYEQVVDQLPPEVIELAEKIIIGDEE